jgi:hypothetical protein
MRFRFSTAACALLLVASAPLRAQAPAPSDSALSCSDDLRLLRDKIERNYAGFRLEVKDAKRRRFDAAYAALEKRAATVAGLGCYQVLRDLIDWFDDPHLFLYETARLDTAETRRRAAAVPRVVTSEDAVREHVRRRGKRLDPIEGIWYDGAARLAVLPDSTAGRGHFVAVMLTADSATWTPGAVRARLTRQGDGRYDVELWERNFALRHRRATLHKRVLLRLSPGMWGKSYPVAAADSGLLDPTDAHRPTLLARNGTVIVSIPSHDGPYKAVLDRLVRENESALKSAERLIVDLRGNEGGGSGMSNSLLPYIRSNPQRPARYDGEAVMLSSDDQIEYARRAFGAETNPFVKSLLERLRAHPGEFVPLEDPSTPKPAPIAEPVITGPRRVGLLVDRGTVSASEVLVLQAMRSERATIFGEPTAGALDYQSTQIVGISPRERRWYLGYPTITRSTSLPADGMRGKGIAPQVRLRLARLDDPIARVEQMLK